MFENFSLRGRTQGVAGYHFPCENPERVMCLVHGIGEHSGRYRRMASYLNENNIAVVSMDLRGHGISEGIRGDTAPREEVLCDIEALISKGRELYPGLPLTLYGHSMGGNFCLNYIMKEEEYIPADRYIISAPWVKLCLRIGKPLYYAVSAAAKAVPGLSISSSVPEEKLGNLTFVRPFHSDRLVHNRITLRCAKDCYDFGLYAMSEKGLKELSACEKPFLLMHGDSDRICDPDGSRTIAKAFGAKENFRYIEWHGYCHEIHNGGKDATGEKVIETICNFVKE